jgi:DNA-directed RNA polymerase omega subunit
MKGAGAAAAERKSDAPRRSPAAWPGVEEIAAWREYDYLVVNRHLDEAVRQLGCIIEPSAAAPHGCVNIPDLPETPTSKEVDLMSFPAGKVSERISNRYLLVVLSAKRSRQLNRGALPQVESKRKKWTSVALEEVIAGKVHPAAREEAAGRGGRRTGS